LRQVAQFDPSLSRKYELWRETNYEINGHLIISIMHPITKQSLETHIAVIELKETPKGFRVLATDVMPIDSLDSKKREMVLHSLRTALPGKLICVAMFVLQAIAGEIVVRLAPVVVGEEKDINMIQEDAFQCNNRHNLLLEIVNQLD
jgi:hypothetical protein